MLKDEYIVIEMKITKRSYGTERKDKLITMSNPIEMSPEFKNVLWEDYNIDIEELEEEVGNSTNELKVEI